MTSRNRAIFLDRDGVLNAMVYDDTHGLLDSPRRPEEVHMIPGAGRFIAAAKRDGWKVIVITNQPGIAKGYFSVDDLALVHDALREQVLAEGGVAWDDLCYCPHHPAGASGRQNEFVMPCVCRKPEPGMLLEAARRHEVDLSASWMIGDGLVDVQAGRRAGCRTLLVTGSLKLEVIERFISMKDACPDAVAKNLQECLTIIKESAT